MVPGLQVLSKFGACTWRSEMGVKYPYHISIKDFRHRVTLASAQDIVVNASQIIIRKEAVHEAWAAIIEEKQSYQAPGGTTLVIEGTQDTRNTPTHCIYMNYRADMDVTSRAWIYEARLKSAPKWYKILSVGDYEQRGLYWEFKVRLTEQGEVASPPVVAEKDPAFGVVPITSGWPARV